MIINYFIIGCVAMTMFLFWLFAGLLLSPFWLIVSIFGAIINAWSYKDIPRIFKGLVFLEWFL